MIVCLSRRAQWIVEEDVTEEIGEVLVIDVLRYAKRRRVVRDSLEFVKEDEKCLGEKSGGTEAL